MGHDAHDVPDVPLQRRVADVGAVQPGGRVGEQARELAVGDVPALVADDVALDRAADEREVPEQVEDLVAHELVGEAQRRLVHDAGGTDDDGIVHRAAFDQALLAQPLDILPEDEGARGGDLVLEGLRVDVEGGVLGAQHRLVVLDREADAKAVVGQGEQLDIVLDQADRLLDLEVAYRRALAHDSGLLDAGDVVRAAAVGRLRGLVAVQFDDDVVEAEAGQGGQHVLHRVDAVAVARERGVAKLLRHRRREVDVNGKIQRWIQIDAPEDDAGVGRRRVEMHAHGIARVQPDALVHEIAGQRPLLPDHGAVSFGAWESPRRRATSPSNSRTRRTRSGSRVSAACRRRAWSCGRAG